MVIEKDKLVILAAFIGALGVGVYLLDGGDSPKPRGAAAGPLKPSAANEFRGITLQLHSGNPKRKYEKRIDEIIEDAGANTLSLVVHGYQENCSSTSIFVDARHIPTRDRIKALIAYAHGKKLRVVLMPVVLLENAREDEWRGKIKPTSWDDWWEDYGNFITHWAMFAAECNVEMMMVGSELVSTEEQTNRWRKLIARVRKVYPKGRLSYSANWDHYWVPQFWDDLDVVGMTTYHDLTGGKDPTLTNIMAGWEPIKAKILKWQKTVNRPIIFTEVGWPNQVTCAQYPWDYYRSRKKTAPAAQAACFEAFFKTWINEKCVAGMLVWEWRTYDGENVDPDTDDSYVPCGKPAMEVIRKYFKADSPNATTAPTTTSAPTTTRSSS